MLFMSIFTFDPDKRDAVIKRAAEKGPQIGGKIIGQWHAIGCGRVFRVVEADDPKAMAAAVMAFSDLGQTEVVPIITTEDLMKIVASKK